jgi:hypothetical protein
MRVNRKILIAPWDGKKTSFRGHVCTAAWRPMAVTIKASSDDGPDSARYRMPSTAPAAIGWATRSEKSRWTPFTTA